MSLSAIDRLLQTAPAIRVTAQGGTKPGTPVVNQRPARIEHERSYPGIAEIRAAQHQLHQRVVLLTAASPLEAGRSGALA